METAALERGEWIVKSRNWLSTLAYQGYGSSLDLATIQNLTEEFLPKKYLEPDLSVILHLDSESRLRRLDERGDDQTKDAFESKSSEFQTRVHAGYQQIAANFHLPLIDATQSIEQIHEALVEKVEALLEVAGA